MIRTLVLLGLCCLTASCQRTPAIETVDVLVAVEDLPMGTKLSEPERRFRLARYLKGYEPSDAIADTSTVKGRVTMRPLAKDQPVRQTDLAAEAVQHEIKYCVLTLVNHAGRNGGFMLPGSRLDLLEGIELGEERRRTEVVLEHVEVLAVGAAGEHSHQDLVTVAVPVEYSARLTKASREGRLYGVLRRNSDTPEPRKANRGQGN